MWTRTWRTSTNWGQCALRRENLEEISAGSKMDKEDVCGHRGGSRVCPDTARWFKSSEEAEWTTGFVHSTLHAAGGTACSPWGWSASAVGEGGLARRTLWLRVLRGCLQASSLPSSSSFGSSPCGFGTPFLGEIAEDAVGEWCQQCGAERDPRSEMSNLWGSSTSWSRTEGLSRKGDPIRWQSVSRFLLCLGPGGSTF